MARGALRGKRGGDERARQHRAAPLLNSAWKIEEGGSSGEDATRRGAGMGPSPGRRAVP
jgi:hypothetical protein